MVDIRSKQLKIKWYYKKGIKFGKILLHFTINIYKYKYIYIYI